LPISAHRLLCILGTAVLGCSSSTAPVVRDAAVGDAAADAAAEMGVATDAARDGALLPGPYGRAPHDRAGPFTLPTLAGDWVFADEWTGQESLFFMLYSGGDEYGDALWQSSLSDLISASPRSAHYFFLSIPDHDGVDRVATHIESLRQRLETSLAALRPADRTYWRAHLHIVPRNATELEGWIGELARANPPPLHFAIDRFLRVRQIGMLLWPHAASYAEAEIFYLAFEARHFDFEVQREAALAAYPALVLPVFAATPVGDAADGRTSPDIFADVAFPPASELATYDTLHYDLTLACPGRTQANCPAWDYFAQLYLCDRDKPDRCDTEIARWVTTYGREGRWVTDMTPVLALVAEGGPRRVRLNSTQAYEVDLTVRLTRRGRGGHPAQAQPLWTGGPFNQDYDALHPLVSFNVPSGVVRVELYALLSGHGWGVDAANCAEFCNHQHRFTINGTPFLREHPAAGTSTGCADRLEEGVVPNQFGTWPFGRGGWCPGLDVQPYVVDLTPHLVAGSNTLKYEGLFKGAPYVPAPSPNPSANGFAAQITLTSYLIFWR
jgi:hypothetical protein